MDGHAEEGIAEAQSQESTGAVEAAFDEARFREYVDDDLVLARRVVRRLLADAPTRLAAIRAALRAGDAATAASATHALKGSISLVAAAPVLEAVGRLELRTREGDLLQAADACTDLENEMAGLYIALARFLSREPNRFAVDPSDG